MLRTKLVAILIGPSGIGLLGLYQSVIDLVRSATNMGIEPAAIRETAKASSIDDENGLKKVLFIFNRCFLFIGIFGAVCCVVFCVPLSLWAFNDTYYAYPIAFLSVPVLLISIAAGWSAILQGLRKISFLAKALLFESILGLVLIIPFYYFLGTEGIIAALIVNAVIAFGCVFYYYRKLGLEEKHVATKEVLVMGKKALHLGIFVVLGGVVNTGSMLFVRAYLSSHVGLEAVGIFQASWTIVAVFTGFIIGSAGTDFFSRLCAIEQSNLKVRRLVNQQTYFLLLISTPMIVGLLLMFPLIINLLYSSAFHKSEEVLQWQIMGAYLKILATPIASVLLAKHKGWLYFLSEVIFFLVYILTTMFFALNYNGVQSAGIGYFVAYAVYLVVVFRMGRATCAFRWRGEVREVIIITLFFAVSSFSALKLEFEMSLFIMIFLFIASLFYSYLRLKRFFKFSDLISWFRKN